MAGEALLVGGSLRVPNVQALAAASGDLEVIPDRYLRRELEGETAEDGGGNDVKLQVVDLGKLLGDPSFRAEEAAKLRLACEDSGFFQLVNHGVPHRLMRRMAAALEEFFAQTLEEKMASSKQPEGSVEGYGQAFVVSEEQKLDWADMLLLVTQPPHLRNFTLWPTHPTTFRETLEEYSLEMKRVALSLLASMAENLGLAPEKLTGPFIEGMQAIRMNYYPPCRHHADKVLGLSPHSDRDGLTLLLQTSPVPGLQISKNGKWLTIDPLPGALIVNIGDILEIFTNGRYKSIKHRAIVDRERRRLSVATFCNPGIDEIIGPLEDLTTDARPLYRTLSSKDFLKQLFANELHGKNFLDYMKLI